MSLRIRIALVLAAVVLGYAVLDHLLQRRMLMPRFAQLEREEASRGVERARQGVLAELEQLDSLCAMWSRWDDSRDYLAAARESGDTAAKQHFERANLGLETFRNLGIHLAYFVDGNGWVRFGAIRDLKTGRDLKWRELALDRLASNHSLLAKNKDGAWTEKRALVLSDVGPMFITSRPVRSSRGEGPPVGTLILGRLLDDALVERVSERTRMPVHLWPLTGVELPAEESSALDEITSANGAWITERGEKLLAGYTTLDSERGIPAVLVRADVPRDVSATGEKLMSYALISTAVAGFLLLLVLLFVLRRTVVDPITTLTRHALDIGSTDDYSRRLGVARADELGVLAREFDVMLEKLERSHQHMVGAARTAGMSEIATGVLHNVGNALNSVSVSCTLVAEKVRTSKFEKLAKLNELVESKGEQLGEFIAKDPKGRHVAPYLRDVTRALHEEREAVENELRSLAKGVEHIRTLVAAQQELAGHSDVTERVDVEAQIELAIGIALRAAGSGDEVDVVRQFQDVGRPSLDRHKLIAILVNLLKNAREAIVERGVERGAARGHVEIKLEREGETLRISVRDDGVGIAAHNLARVFQYGFTTKPGGHGFGLHSSANSATESGGRLTAHSDGLGRGATFVLELPCAPVALAA